MIGPSALSFIPVRMQGEGTQGSTLIAVCPAQSSERGHALRVMLVNMHTDLMEGKSTSVNVGGGVNVNSGKGKPGGTSVNVGKGGVNVNTGKGKPGGTAVNVGKGGVNVNTGNGKPGGGTHVNVGRKGGVGLSLPKTDHQLATLITTTLSYKNPHLPLPRGERGRPKKQTRINPKKNLQESTKRQTSFFKIVFFS